jgi:murein DD-endopeptidase MepM/ murein hydrolase activator NlpD
MDTFSLIVVSDETSPVRRFEVRKDLLKRSAIAAGLAVVLLLALFADYVRMRIDNAELEGLRAETIERRAQVAAFQEQLQNVDGKLSRLQEFERKVRIIANLPGSAGTGGDDVGEAPAEDAHGGEGGLEVSVEGELPAEPGPPRIPQPQESDPIQEKVSLLHQSAVYLSVVAEGQEVTLAQLVDSLEGKQHFLESSPSVWPTKGWLTSRYGYRTSPFTNKRQFHAGIDIAGAPGTAVLAPARGKVVFSGKRGPLGNAVIIDHGYGIRTQYGHNDEVFVKTGEEIERGRKIATLGNSGRSTGPHLHYVVEVRGKTRDPLDYIFD